MHDRARPSFLPFAIVASATVLLAACSAVRMQPAYSACGSQAHPACSLPGNEQVEVLYEATCDGECEIRFALPMANLGAERFTGEFRRRVTFAERSSRSVDLEVTPLADTFVVTRARIRVDGEIRARMDREEARPGRTVRLGAVLPVSGR